MSRIEITCSEKDMEELKEIFQNNCPFMAKYPENCGEDASCSDCIERHIEFSIIE